MPKYAVVSSNDLFNAKKNPNLCISAQRVFKSCDECNSWKQYQKKNPLMSPDEIIENMTCAPQVTNERIESLSQIFNNSLKIRNINEQIDKEKKKLQEL